jgi:hypothetical protein
MLLFDLFLSKCVCVCACVGNSSTDKKSESRSPLFFSSSCHLPRKPTPICRFLCGGAVCCSLRSRRHEKKRKEELKGGASAAKTRGYGKRRRSSDVAYPTSLFIYIHAPFFFVFPRSEEVVECSSSQTPAHTHIYRLVYFLLALCKVLLFGKRGGGEGVEEEKKLASYTLVRGALPKRIDDIMCRRPIGGCSRCVGIQSTTCHHRLDSVFFSF